MTITNPREQISEAYRGKRALLFVDVPEASRDAGTLPEIEGESRDAAVDAAGTVDCVRGKESSVVRISEVSSREV